MDRGKVFVDDGSNPNGEVHASDLLDIVDRAAALNENDQEVTLAVLHIVDGGLALSKYGAAEIQLAGSMRTTKIIRALGGFIPPTMTTSARNALSATDGPALLIIFNSTTAQLEYNAGSGGSPNWQPLSATALVDSSVTTAKINDGAVTSAKIADGTIVAADISGTLKPSQSAAAGDEALRAIGATADTVIAGNDSRMTNTRTPTDASVITAKLADAAVTTVKIADGAMTTSKIATGAVTSASILDGSIVVGDLAFDPATQAELDAVAVSRVPLSLIDHGSATVTTDSGGGAFIGFNKTFPGNPSVVFVVDVDSNEHPRLAATSTTGFSIGWINHASYGPFVLTWIAIGT